MNQQHQHSITAQMNAHTLIHNAIASTKEGRIVEAKGLLTRAIAALANGLAAL